MRRGRCWRRWRSDVVTDRFFHKRWMQESHDRLYISETRPAFTYRKRLSADEIVDVAVWDKDDLRDWLRYTARKSRDNRAPCSCWCCCNPRRSGSVKPKDHDPFGDRRRKLACEGDLRTAFKGPEDED